MRWSFRIIYFKIKTVLHLWKEGRGSLCDRRFDTCVSGNRRVAWIRDGRKGEEFLHNTWLIWFKVFMKIHDSCFITFGFRISKNQICRTHIFSREERSHWLRFIGPSFFVSDNMKITKVSLYLLYNFSFNVLNLFTITLRLYVVLQN